MKKTTIIAGLSIISIAAIGVAAYSFISVRTVRTFPAVLAMKLDYPPAMELGTKKVVVLKTPTKAYADLSRIGTDAEILSWLSTYDDKISFPDNYWFIEYASMVDEDKILKKSPYTTPKTLAQIKIDLAGSLHPAPYATYKETYDKFIQVSINGNIAKIDPVDSYDPSYNLFSFPLFESIYNNHHLNDNATFEFATGEINGKTSIFFRVKAEGDSNYLGYYDFSNKPPYLEVL